MFVLLFHFRFKVLGVCVLITKLLVSFIRVTESANLFSIQNIS